MVAKYIFHSIVAIKGSSGSNENTSPGCTWIVELCII